MALLCFLQKDQISRWKVLSHSTLNPKQECLENQNPLLHQKKKGLHMQAIFTG